MHTISCSSTLRTAALWGSGGSSPAAGARVVAESDHRAPLDLSLPLAHERRYGDTLIRIHTA